MANLIFTFATNSFYGLHAFFHKKNLWNLRSNKCNNFLLFFLAYFYYHYCYYIICFVYFYSYSHYYQYYCCHYNNNNNYYDYYYTILLFDDITGFFTITYGMFFSGHWYPGGPSYDICQNKCFIFIFMSTSLLNVYTTMLWFLL